MNLFRFYQGPEPLRWPRFDDFVAYDSEELNSTARFVASLRDALPLLEDAMGGSAGFGFGFGQQNPHFEEAVSDTRFVVRSRGLWPEFTYWLCFLIIGSQQAHTN